MPWNFPQTLAMFKLAPLLAAGCTVVIKSSPETVLDSLLLAEAIIEAGLPAGVVNIVPAGREVGAYLVEHPGIDKVAFTGSSASGRVIARRCGELLRPVTLELGGKSAAIVLDDADLADATEALFGATMLNNGQTCFICTRVLAPRSRYDEVLEVFGGLADALVVGDSLDPATQLGPVASARQRDRIEGYIEKGRAEGGRIVAGGGRPQELERGWFVQPTIFADVDNSDTIAREEIFGPVLAVIPYDSVDEAVAIANDSEFGLGGSVWSGDVERANAVARRVQTGTIGINHYMLDPAAPFGGVKASGIGTRAWPRGPGRVPAAAVGLRGSPAAASRRVAVEICRPPDGERQPADLPRVVSGSRLRALARTRGRSRLDRRGREPRGPRRDHAPGPSANASGAPS